MTKFLICVFCACFVSGCSQPILESANCLEARDAVKKLYSLHMDGGSVAENQTLDRIRSFLSADLAKHLEYESAQSKDYLTQSNKFPKAFRAGVCRDVDDAVEFEVLLFSSQESGGGERKILVSAIKETGWVVNAVRGAS